MKGFNEFINEDYKDVPVDRIDELERKIAELERKVAELEGGKVSDDISNDTYHADASRGFTFYDTYTGEGEN